MGEAAAGRPETVGVARTGSPSDHRLLTVEELARRTGLSVEEARGRIVAGDPPPRVIDVDGRLEVRVAAEDADRLAESIARGEPDRPAAVGQGAPGPLAPAGGGQPAGGPSESGEPGVAPPGTALVAAPAEMRQLAAGLADELFERWELAMQRQFKDELTVRLRSEIEHRQRQVADLREEVEQRAEERFGPRGRKVVGTADRYATWERERTLVRQSREVTEIERQMQEMRERLRELGAAPDDATITVDQSHDEGGSAKAPLEPD